MNYIPRKELTITRARPWRNQYRMSLHLGFDHRGKQKTKSIYGHTVEEVQQKAEAFKRDYELGFPSKRLLKTYEAYGQLPLGIRKLYQSCERNAKTRGILFRLSKLDFLELVNESESKCMVSGVPFTEEFVGKARTRPMYPSIDRIDSHLGYSKENCRLVCLMVNYALSAWGEEPFQYMMQYMAARRIF